MNCLGNPPNSTRKEHRMLDILFLSRSSLLYAVLLLSAIKFCPSPCPVSRMKLPRSSGGGGACSKKTLSPKAAAVPRLLPGFRRNSAAGKSLRRCLYLWKRLLT